MQRTEETSFNSNSDLLGKNNVPNSSPRDPDQILTRNIPNSRPTQQGYPAPPNQPGQFIQPGQPMRPMGQPMQPMQTGFQGQQMLNPNMIQPNGVMMGVPSQGPSSMGGNPYMQGPGMNRPGYGGPVAPNGYPGMNPGMGNPGQFGRPVPMMNNRFDGDNRGMQNVQDTGPSNYETSQVCMGKCTGWMGTYLPCLGCCANPYKNVPEGHSGVVMRFGKFHKLVGPGMHYLLPDLDTLEIIDKREKVVELKHQSVVSRDNTTFTLDAVLYYRIVNTYKSRFAVSNLSMSLTDLAVTTLRNAVGRMTMQQFLEARDHLADQIEADIAQIANSWGVKVLRVLVQDVYLPLEFRNTFSSGAVAKRISEAQVIASKAEVEVAKLMKDAAAALSTDAAFQIRYIAALEAIAHSSNPKMIFFPADFNDVGTANTDLVSAMAEEMDTLLRKR